MKRWLTILLCLTLQAWGQQSGDGLPTSPRQQAFQRLSSTVNDLLESGQDVSRRIRLGEHLEGSGESCYCYLFLDGKKVGLICPEGNETVNIEAEANMWSLLRLFEHPEVGQPAGYIWVGPWGQRQYIEKTADLPAFSPRALHRSLQLEHLQGETPVRFLFKWFDNNHFAEYNDPMIGNHLDPDYLLTRFLDVDGRRPTNAVFQLTNEGGNSELMLAQQFSTALVADRLQGEFDRWTGSNVAVQYWNGRASLGWFDNGGAEFDDHDDGDQFERYIYRFDPIVVERIRDLDLFLTGRASHFLGFKSLEEVRHALNLYSDRGWYGFQHNLHEVRLTIEERTTTAEALLR